MPPGAVAVANLESAWGRILGSHDDRVFRDESGDFHTLAPVTSQIARLYIPYGVVRHRKAGIYTMSISVVLPKQDGSGGDTLAYASTKIALPPPQPWRKIEFLWPFIALCMTVVRADEEISRAEIRPLKALLTHEFGLTPADMEGLRFAMKLPPPEDIPGLIAAVRLRMPYLDPCDLVATLLRVASYDGPINLREHATLRLIAAHARVDDLAWSRLIDLHG